MAAPSQNEQVRVPNSVQCCLYCGGAAGIVWVHGHGQCVECGINVDECCRGEQCAVNTTEEYESSS